MKKSIALIAIALITGIFSGAGGMYYRINIYPEQQVQRMLEKQETQMREMVRSGEVIDVKTDEIKIKVEQSSKESLKGKELAVKINKDTTVQEGMKILENVDIANRLKPGMRVNVMEKNGTALVVHWEG